MRRIALFACLIATSLAACAPAAHPDIANNATEPIANRADATGLPCPSNATGNSISNSTRLDERLALGVEGAYAAARTAAELAVDAGIVKGAAATRLRAANKRAYDAVQAVRAAYCAGNQTSYVGAAVKATEAVSAFLANSKGDK